MIAYETPQSLRAKAHYVQSRGLRGVMYWEHSADDGTLLRALHEHLP